MRAARNWLVRAAVGLILLVGSAAPVLAQEAKEERYLDVPHAEFGTPWLQWVVGSLFIILVVGIAFKNPHRSHLD